MRNVPWKSALGSKLSEKTVVVFLASRVDGENILIELGESITLRNANDDLLGLLQAMRQQFTYSAMVFKDQPAGFFVGKFLPVEIGYDSLLPAGDMEPVHEVELSTGLARAVANAFRLGLRIDPMALALKRVRGQ